MEESDKPRWPRFALRRIALPPGTPEPVRAVLDANGVPERGVGGEYVSLDEARFAGGRSRFLAFGCCGPSGLVCLDTGSLAVVHLPAEDGTQVNPVNASLPAFIACVGAAIARFPYYTYETFDDLGEAVAAELRDRLTEIDETADAHNGLWETFVDDVGIGDYAEEEFLPG